MLKFFALVAFNLPIAVTLISAPFLRSIGDVLREKSPVDASLGGLSYSRVTGALGAIIVTAFYWAIGNIVLDFAIDGPEKIGTLIAGVVPYFAIGSALFLPYAFNQLRQMFAKVAPAGSMPADTAGTAGVATTRGASGGVAKAASGVPARRIGLTVANLSSSIDDATLAAKLVAIGRQVNEHFAPEWNIGADLVVKRLEVPGDVVNLDTPTDAIIYLGDKADDPTTGTDKMLGYHFVNYENTPYGFVYLDACQQFREDWSVTLSHEILELLADPNAVCTVAGPDPRAVATQGSSVNFSLEVCDPTQGDTYCIGDVRVSNFVNRSYFGQLGGSPSTNYLGLRLDPFGIRPGGYVQVSDAGGPSPPIFGFNVSADKKAAKEAFTRMRRNGRRASRIMSDASIS